MVNGGAIANGVDIATMVGRCQGGYHGILGNPSPGGLPSGPPSKFTKRWIYIEFEGFKNLIYAKNLQKRKICKR